MENVNVRESNELVSQRERQLVLNSKYICKYPDVKKILEKYLKIKRSDLDNGDSTEDVKNILLYSFKEIVSEVEEEWYVPNRDPDYRHKSIPCSLCNTPNKYIYYIRNRYTGKELNVGSECIHRFKKIEQMGNKSLEARNRQVYQHELKVRRINEFNSNFPFAERMTESWKEEFDNLPFVMTKQINTSFFNIYMEAKDIYNSYVKGDFKRNFVKEFEEVIKKHELLKIDINKAIEILKNERFACDYKVKKWLKQTSQNHVLNIISMFGGVITRESIKNIYCPSFVCKFWNEYRKMIEDTGFTVTNFNNKVISLEYKTSIKVETYNFEYNIKDFMSRFGSKIFDKNKEINSHDLIRKIKLAKTEENYLKIFNFFNSYLVKTGHELEFEFYSNHMEFTKDKKDKYAVGVTEHFVNSHKWLLLVEEKEVKKELLKTMKHLSWRPKSEKEKYEVDEKMISRNPSYRK